MSFKPNISDYKALSEIEHVLRRPDTYIGSIQQILRSNEFIYDYIKQRMLRGNISVPQGLEQIVREPAANIADNIFRSIEAGIDPGTVEVQVTRDTVTMRNGGCWIPVEIHPQVGTWVQIMIFGMLRTGSNYDDNKPRRLGGRNGLGVKCSNIFSKWFSVKCGDPNLKRHITVVWANNMSQIIQCDIQENYQGSGYTEVSFQPDLARFGYQQINDDVIMLFARSFAELGYTCKVPVFFNGVEIKASTIEQFVGLFFEKGTNLVIHREYPTNTQMIEKNKKLVPVDSKAQPFLEAAIIDSPDSGFIVGYVNGILSRKGVHVNAIFDEAISGILQTINDDTKLIKMSDVTKHVSMIISYTCVNPTWKSQAKEELASPTPTVKIRPADLVQIKKWKFVEKLYAEMEAKVNKQMDKDVKRGSWSKVEKHRPAVWCGKAGLRTKAVLILIEGVSAASYPKKMSRFVPNGREMYGFFPLGGKVFNVRDAPVTEIMKNDVISQFKTVTGIKEGVDYSIPQNYAELNYGRVLLMTDADADGKHIKGLILNLIACRWPSLLKIGYIMEYNVPVVRQLYKGKTYPFYSLHEYNKFLEQIPENQRRGLPEPNYFKGLGTSTDDDIKQDLAAPKVFTFFYDEKAPETLELAFGIKHADVRKQWILQYQHLNVEALQAKNISDFINYEMVEYAIENKDRSLPGLDGLKLSQRMIVHFGKIKQGEKNHKIKLPQLIGYIAENSAYHHGEPILIDTTVRMAATWIGSNNLPLFQELGQFGTRDSAGEDAASARYIFTAMSPLLDRLLPKEFKHIQRFRIDENKEQEPLFLHFILPIAMLNGSKGIATGFSTTILAHDPLDVSLWYKCRLNGMKPPMLIPWYRGFRGEIRYRKKVSKTGETKSEYVISGNYEIKQMKNGVQVVHVTEIPIGISIQGYRASLNKMEEDKIIDHYDDYSQDDYPNFIIYGMKEVNHKTLKLRRKVSSNNMYMLNENGVPVKFETTDHLMEAYYIKMIGHYQELKNYQLNELQTKISEAEAKYRFYWDVANEVIKVWKQKKDVIYTAMDARGHDRKLYDGAKLSEIDEDDLNKLLKIIEKLRIEYEEIYITSPEQMWYKHIDAFERQYCSHYSVSPHSIAEVEARVLPVIDLTADSEQKGKKNSKQVEQTGLNGTTNGGQTTDQEERSAKVIKALIGNSKQQPVQVKTVSQTPQPTITIKPGVIIQSSTVQSNPIQAQQTSIKVVPNVVQKQAPQIKIQQQKGINLSGIGGPVNVVISARG